MNSGFYKKPVHKVVAQGKGFEEQELDSGFDFSGSQKAVDIQSDLTMQFSSMALSKEEDHVRIQLQAEEQGKAREEEDRLQLQAEEQRKAREEEDRLKLQAEEQRKAREEEDRLQLQAEEQRKAREEEDRLKLQAEEQRKAREEEDRLQRLAEEQKSPKLNNSTLESQLLEKLATLGDKNQLLEKLARFEDKNKQKEQNPPPAPPVAVNKAAKSSVLKSNTQEAKGDDLTKQFNLTLIDKFKKARDDVKDNDSDNDSSSTLESKVDDQSLISDASKMTGAVDDVGRLADFADESFSIEKNIIDRSKKDFGGQIVIDIRANPEEGGVRFDPGLDHLTEGQYLIKAPSGSALHYGNLLHQRFDNDAGSNSSYSRDIN